MPTPATLYTWGIEELNAGPQVSETSSTSMIVNSKPMHTIVVSRLRFIGTPATRQLVWRLRRHSASDLTGPCSDGPQSLDCGVHLVER